jgi:hypothetical protein
MKKFYQISSIILLVFGFTGTLYYIYRAVSINAGMCPGNSVCQINELTYFWLPSISLFLSICSIIFFQKKHYALSFLFALATILVYIPTTIKTSWPDKDNLDAATTLRIQTCENHGLQIKWLGFERVDYKDKCANF